MVQIDYVPMFSTGYQVQKYLFKNPNRSTRESNWLQTLGDFGICPIILKHRNIQVLGDALSRETTRERESVVNDVKVSHICIDNISMQI